MYFSLQVRNKPHDGCIQLCIYSWAVSTDANSNVTILLTFSLNMTAMSGSRTCPPLSAGEGGTPPCHIGTQEMATYTQHSELLCTCRLLYEVSTLYYMVGKAVTT
jgi:hypothetical protein